MNLKKTFSIFFILVFAFSCGDTSDEIENQQINYELLKRSFRDLTTESLNFSTDLEFVEFDPISDNEVQLLLNVEEVSLTIERRLMNHQFKGSNISEIKLLPVSPTLLFDTESNARVNESVNDLIDTVSLFGSNQKLLMKELTDQIFTLKYLDEGYEILDSYDQNVSSSTELSENERIQLTEFISSTRALLDFMVSGGVAAMYAQMAPEFNDSASSNDGRVMGCDVGWRSVWAGAVVGFTVGAVKGGITGATGGTVVFPGLGTATGAVGGAVFGGALGFIGGATTSVAANLVTSCFRPTQRGAFEASCRQTYEYYLKGWVKSFPYSCYSVIYSNSKCC